MQTTPESRSEDRRSAQRDSTANPDRPAAASAERRDDGRGRAARSPREIPKRGWKDVLWRVKGEIGNDNVTIVAAGIAFYLFLAVFPALFATVSIYGLLADPAQVEQQAESLQGVLPQGALDVLTRQLGSLAQSSSQTLGWGAAVSLLLALWSAAKGAKAMIGGINIAYDERETRGWFKVQGLALLFTLGFVVFLVLSVALIAVVPNVLGRVELGPVANALALILQWALLLGLILAALAAIYRWAPSRDEPRWRWVSLGSGVAAVLWLVASALFSWYAANFGSFNETYGTIAGAVVLLLWLQISALVVLLGAELNAETEHQTAVDSTEGRPEPMGRRGAAKADTLGEARH